MCVCVFLDMLLILHFLPLNQGEDKRMKSYWGPWSGQCSLRVWNPCICEHRQQILHVNKQPLQPCSEQLWSEPLHPTSVSVLHNDGVSICSRWTSLSNMSDPQHPPVRCIYIYIYTHACVLSYVAYGPAIPSWDSHPFLQAVKLEQRRQSRVVASFQASTMVVLICSPLVIKHG